MKVTVVGGISDEIDLTEENFARQTGGEIFVVGALASAGWMPAAEQIVFGLWIDFQGSLIYLNSSDKCTIGLVFYYSYNSDGSFAEKTNKMMEMCTFINIVPMALFSSACRNR